MSREPRIFTEAGHSAEEWAAIEDQYVVGDTVNGADGSCMVVEAITVEGVGGYTPILMAIDAEPETPAPAPAPDRAVFEVRQGVDGHSWKLHADGTIDGFPEGCLVFNRIPVLVRLAAAVIKHEDYGRRTVVDLSLLVEHPDTVVVVGARRIPLRELIQSWETMAILRRLAPDNPAWSTFTPEALAEAIVGWSRFRPMVEVVAALKGDGPAPWAEPDR